MNRAQNKFKQICFLCKIDRPQLSKVPNKNIYFYTSLTIYQYSEQFHKQRRDQMEPKSEKSTKKQPYQQKKRKSCKIYKLKRNQLRTRLLKTKFSSHHDDPINGSIKTIVENQFIDSIKIEELNCPICLQLFVFPFTLRCDHTFCYMCLDQLSRFTSVNDCCPCCRNSIGDHYPIRSRNIEKLLASLVSQRMSSDQKRNYLMRKAKALQELQERAQEIKNVTVFQKIDFKVGNHWEEGRVIKIKTKEKKIKIEVQSKSSQIVYVFSSSSSHLALYRTYTRNDFWEIEDFFNFNTSNLLESQGSNFQIAIAEEQISPQRLESIQEGDIAMDRMASTELIQTSLQNFASLRTESSEIELGSTSSLLQ